MWIKIEVDKLIKKGPQWKWVDKAEAPAPAINKIFLDTKYRLYTLYLYGPAAKKILGELKKKINSIYFEGFSPDVGSVYFGDEVDISLHCILEKNGSAEVQL